MFIGGAPPMMVINGMSTRNPLEGLHVVLGCPELIISDESAHFCRRPVRSCRHVGMCCKCQQTRAVAFFTVGVREIERCARVVQ